jgi:hypothetical protein
MVGIKKPSTIRFIVVILGLFLAFGIHKAWSLMAVHKRPWLLEAFLRSRLAECRTGPDLIFFREEWENLATHVRKTDVCLDETDKRIWFRRNYSDCIPMILSAGLDARILSLKQQQRRQDHKKILEELLRSMREVMNGNGSDRKIWARYNLSNIEEGRAKSLFKQAQSLYTQGEIESALTAALRARMSWHNFSSRNDSKFARFSDASLRNKWSLQVDRLLNWSKQNGRRAIIVDKLEHRCFLINRGNVQKHFSADLGRNWHQRKSQSQDASLPEGEYVITRLIPRGKYGQALLINYPNDEDKARFQSLKRSGAIPERARIGNYIEIHGRGGQGNDWTDGCVALLDEDMRDLYRYAYTGMPVTIVGTSRWASSVKD